MGWKGGTAASTNTSQLQEPGFDPALGFCATRVYTLANYDMYFLPYLKGMWMHELTTVNYPLGAE